EIVRFNPSPTHVSQATLSNTFGIFPFIGGAPDNKDELLLIFLQWVERPLNGCSRPSKAFTFTSPVASDTFVLYSPNHNTRRHRSGRALSILHLDTEYFLLDILDCV